MKIFISTLFLCLFIQSGNAQDALLTAGPASDLLVNGILYYPLHSRASGNPNYPMDDWAPASVYIKGEVFEVEHLRHDVEQQRAVLQYFIKGQGLRPIQLNPNLVDSFRVEGVTFVNSRAMNAELDPFFFQKIYDGGFQFWVQTKKTFVEVFSESHPNGKYANPYSAFFIFSDGNLVPIKNESALKNYFKDKKGTIKKYLRQEGFYLSDGNFKELYDLMKFCDELTQK